MKDNESSFTNGIITFFVCCAILIIAGLCCVGLYNIIPGLND